MTRLASSVLGCAAGAAALWLAGFVVDPMALADAQSLVLFGPGMLAGALAGDAISHGTANHAEAAHAFSRSGIATLAIVALFVWLGSESADVTAHLLSAWLLIPSVLGVAQVGVAVWLRHAPRR